MNITKNEIDALNASLHITIEPSDYEEKFKDELNKYRGKASLKGFRKGKTPIATIKKMYGKAILAETINNILGETLNTYLTEEKIETLGQPIPTEDTEVTHFDVKNLGDYKFDFDLGIAPQFEVAGMDDGIEKKVVEVAEESVTEEFELARKRFGGEIFPEDDIEDNDLLTLSAVELDGDKVKKKGWETGFQILVKDLEDSVKEEVLKLKKGGKFKFNIRSVEKDKDEKHVNKYLLNLDEDEEKEIGDMFEGTIDKVSRISPAEINQEFFDKYTGQEGAETSEEEIRAKIRANIEEHYNTQTKNLMFKEIMDHLMEANKIELPNAFLKRWLKLSNENATDEVIEAEFEAFSQNLKWNLIKSKLEAKYEIEVLPEDIKEGFKKRIAGYFGGNPQGIDLDQMAESMMKNQEQFRQVFEEEKAEKLFQAISADMNIVENPISLDEFKELVKKVNEEAA
ncbi:trigger factor [Portibacter lacus]|uniref:Trigger factor n=1 Tax=Portibacter lacus TaxID=1099794 RepID=A0AA37SRY0_9BACT|nr:trigger factor [Portibacter lacus]GLR19741.1 peptidylprolyl isomerase [Portibacter lacus]